MSSSITSPMRARRASELRISSSMFTAGPVGGAGGVGGAPSGGLGGLVSSLSDMVSWRAKAARAGEFRGRKSNRFATRLPEGNGAQTTVFLLGKWLPDV